jgi:nucleotide-binding universal stress UspA family protein
MLHHDLVRPQVHEDGSVLADRRDVVVADDGGWGSRRALDEAGREAHLRGVGLVVVTVRRTPFVAATGYAAWTRAEHDAADYAASANLAAQRRARDVWPGLPVEGVVVSSTDELVPVAANAELLVLGRNGVSGHSVFRMGTTSGDLVGIFRCPVLVCRDERSTPLRASMRSTRDPEVIAAVHVASEVTTVLRTAVKEAITHTMPLCVFSAGQTLSGRMVKDELAAEPSLPWRLVWSSGETEALLRYADPDDLLVLGNRGRARLAGHVTGSWARTVLDRMPCDVMLVPC